MVTAESYPMHVYLCSFCGKTHHVTKKNPRYMDTWTEKCPITDGITRITNLYFIDKL